MKLVAKLKCVCNRKEPHFVPPSFGDRGFYACEVPDNSTEQSDDVRNYDRRDIRVVCDCGHVLTAHDEHGTCTICAQDGSDPGPCGMARQDQPVS